MHQVHRRPHGFARHAPARAKIEPLGNYAEVERRHRPHDIHHPHLLRMPGFVDDNHRCARKGSAHRDPGEQVEQWTFPPVNPKPGHGFQTTFTGCLATAAQYIAIQLCVGFRSENPHL
jgi:hypothetical protein